MIEVARDFAKKVRLLTLKTVYSSKAAHLGSALSMVDIVSVLYNGVLNVEPSNPAMEDRDIFLLSKGHACTSLYATLALKGFFPESDLESFSKDSSIFLSHASHKVPGVELSTGSLGHALSVGCGLAYSFKLKDNSRRVYCLLSDGELDEGSNWEALLFAGHHKLQNLTVIVDYNKIQSFGSVKEVLNLEPISDKFAAFGFSVVRVDGHDIEELYAVFESSKRTQNGPTVIIADTIKGKGVDFMENELLWHYRSPTEEQYQQAVLQIQST